MRALTIWQMACEWKTESDERAERRVFIFRFFNDRVHVIGLRVYITRCFLTVLSDETIDII